MQRYSIYNVNRRQMRQLVEPPQGTEPLGVAERRMEYSFVKWKLPREDNEAHHKARYNRYERKCGFEYYHCAIPLEAKVNGELNNARPLHTQLQYQLLQRETLGKCRGQCWLQSAITLEGISNVILYRGRYHLCSRFDSYLGRCSRGGVGGAEIFVLYSIDFTKHMHAEPGSQPARVHVWT